MGQGPRSVTQAMTVFLRENENHEQPSFWFPGERGVPVIPGADVCAPPTGQCCLQ